MNNLKQLQNEPINLKYLAAQRVLYKKAKAIFGIQILFTVAVSVILSFLKLISIEKMGNDLSAYIGLTSISISFADVIFFNAYVSKIKTKAAKIQELFDCNVYELAWNSTNSGSKPEKYLIEANANQYTADLELPLENWYDIDIEHLSRERAILLCQETNLFYDGQLRDHFKNANIIVCIVVFVLSFVIALFGHMTTRDFVIMLLLPILPVMTITLKIMMENKKSLNASIELKKIVLQLKGINQFPSETALRQIQDKIYCSRKDSSLVPEWYYKWRRKALEKAMKANAVA